MRKDIWGNTHYKIGLHLHSTNSDGLKTPEEIALEYTENGYDAIALTDHWYYTDAGEIHGLKILSGCEYNTGGGDTTIDVMHILGLGMKQNPKIPRDASRQGIIDGIQNAGGIAVLAHPAWSLNTPADALQLKGFMATEIYNAVSEAHESVRPYSGYFADLMANAGTYYGLLATDDAHYYDSSDNCKGWVMVQANDLTEESILNALREGNYYASQGPDVYVKRENSKLKIHTSPCTTIAVLSNLSWAKNRVLRGEHLEFFEYEIKENERWLRVEVTDANGKMAWTNYIMV